MNERIKASRILYDMQEAAREQMEREHPSVDELLDKNIALMVNRIEMIFLKEVQEDENPVSASWPCPSDRATLLRCYETKVGDEQVAYASSNWTLVNYKTRRIMKVKEADLRKYTFGKYRNPYGDKKFRITDEDENNMKEVAVFKVGRNDLDDNGHMNNVVYLKQAEDNVPELLNGSCMLKGARLHFVKETLYDEELHIKFLKIDEGCYFRFYKESGELSFECELIY